MIPLGTRVCLTPYPDDIAVVIANHDTCPHQGCQEPALTVRRDPESFELWRTNYGMFHERDVRIVALPIRQPEERS